MRRVVGSLAGLVVVVALLSGCTSETVVPASAPSVDSEPEPASSVGAQADAAAQADSAEQADAIPKPATPIDQGPVVLAGVDWVITRADVDRLAAFVETVHELEFRGPVAVESDEDIGASFARGIESIDEDDWRLLVALDLIGPDADRDTVNQIRRDRIRGVCCDDEGPELTVIVEPRLTQLETEVIVVHELVHALHRQHPELSSRPGRSGGFEVPSPYDSVVEGIAQFVAFRYFDTQPDHTQAEVRPELPVVTPQLEAELGRVPGALLNFAYSTAPGLAQAAYEESGPRGLSDLLARPPTTTEQVMFPDRWLAGEDRVSQDPPEIPDTGKFLAEGRLGAAVLGWMIEDATTIDERSALLAAWAGDRWTLYQLNGQDCVAGTVEMDDADAASRIAGLLAERMDQQLRSGSEHRVRFDTCAVQYRSGAQVLLEDQIDVLAGRAVGLIANQASQVEGRSTIDVFAESSDFELVSLFAPEHGVRGEQQAGEHVPGGVDEGTGLVVHSLYGPDRSPTPGQLANLDALVYDLQDVGTRFYTFISTMGLAMQAAAAADVEFVVLDRPNPHGRTTSSGFVREPAFESFVGLYPIPSSYTLTPGELAAAIVAESWLPGLEDMKLTVVPMSGWERSAGWTGTGHVWVPPSPGLPTIDSVYAYPGTVLFEATPASVARCTPYAFAAVAGSEFDATEVADHMNEAELAGVSFDVMAVPACPGSPQPTIDGTRWTVTEPRAFDAVASGVHAIAVARQQSASGSLVERPQFLDLLAGTDRLRTMLEAGVAPSEIVDSWQSETAAFDAEMTPYRRYPD